MIDRGAPLYVGAVTPAQCRFATKRWHYAGRMPAATHCFGVWESGRFVGVVLFGPGAAPNIASPFGLRPTEVRELLRVALRDHVAPVSQILAVTVRMLRKRSPDLRLLVSFADTEQGHHGGIYQAAGWTYIGTGSNDTRYRVNGVLVHPRTLGSAYGVGGQSVRWLREHVDPKAEIVKLGPKHKYALALDPQTRVQIEAKRQRPPRGEGDGVSRRSTLTG